MAAMCPYCGSNAPVVHQGLAARCTACGRPRNPLASHSVTLAGQPAQVGGTLARIVGWIAFAIGVPFAMLVGGILHAIFPDGIVGEVVGGAIALATLLVTLIFVRGGKKLQTAGKKTEEGVKDEAVFALAGRYEGILTAERAAAELDVTPLEADDILTALAKRDPDRVKVEVNDAGVVQFQFPRHLWAAVAKNSGGMSSHARVAASAHADAVPGSRVAESGAAIAWDEHLAEAEARAAAKKAGR